MNTKDRERFGIMESQIKDVRNDIQGIHTKLDSFIKCYATKDEVKSLDTKIDKKFQENKENAKSIRDWIPAAICAICALFTVWMALI